MLYFFFFLRYNIFTKFTEETYMTLEQIKKEIYYYSDIEPTDEEAWEILDIYESKPGADLSAIVADYYGC